MAAVSPENTAIAMLTHLIIAPMLVGMHLGSFWFHGFAQSYWAGIGVGSAYCLLLFVATVLAGQKSAPTASSPSSGKLVSRIVMGLLALAVATGLWAWWDYHPIVTRFHLDIAFSAGMFAALCGYAILTLVKPWHS